MAQAAPTRQRLLDAGMAMFASQGFQATTVGDIEAAAGLQPRRGALYKHFASKAALLEAAVARHLDDIATGSAQLAQLSFTPGLDRDLLRPVVVELGRWFLAELDRQHALTALLEREGDRLIELREVVHARIVEPGNGAAAGLLRSVVAESADADAVAVALLGSLIAHRRTAWTFGAPALGVDDDRIVAVWTDLVLATVERLAPK